MFTCVSLCMRLSVRVIPYNTAYQSEITIRAILLKSSNLQNRVLFSQICNRTIILWVSFAKRNTPSTIIQIFCVTKISRKIFTEADQSIPNSQSSLAPFTVSNTMRSEQKRWHQDDNILQNSAGMQRLQKDITS